MLEKIINILFPFFDKGFRIDEEKKQIRFEMRHLKDELTEDQKEKEANAVFRKIELMPEFQAANTILIYWSTTDELPTQSFIKKWCSEKLIILPSINGQKLFLKRFSPEVPMIQRALGIWEPDLTEVFSGKVDLVIVPGVAFDTKKNRLGRGKGYYDRFFRRNKTLKIGVGFEFQLLSSVPINRMDIRMDRIVTSSTIIE